MVLVSSLKFLRDSAKSPHWWCIYKCGKSILLSLGSYGKFKGNITCDVVIFKETAELYNCAQCAFCLVLKTASMFSIIHNMCM